MKSLQHNKQKIDSKNIFMSHTNAEIFMPIPTLIFCSYDLNDDYITRLCALKKIE